MLQRNADQLRKLWDNIKFRRKLEFAKEKRTLLKTGGGPAPDIKIQSDPELDSCGIDIELIDTIDSDSIKLIENNTTLQDYIIIDDVLIPQETRETTAFQLEPSISFYNNDSGAEKEQTPGVLTPPTEKRQEAGTSGQAIVDGKKKTKFNKVDFFKTESDLRIEKLKYSLNLEKELGEMRKEQELLKIKLQKQLLETAIQENAFLKEKWEYFRKSGK